MKLVIVGGVAGGASAAVRARRLDEKAEIIMFERGADVSFANCGLPYHIGEEIKRRDALIVQKKELLESRFKLDVRTRHEVVAIDRRARQVTVLDRSTQSRYQESYDFLLLSPGASPFVPPTTGSELPQIFTLRSMDDMDSIKAAVDNGAKRALVVGAGFIGLEMAENLRRRGLDVDLVELGKQVMPPMDPEMARMLEQELAANGVRLHLSSTVTALRSGSGSALVAKLSSGAELDIDLALFAVGVRPDSALAQAAGLELSPRGAIVVDGSMRTSDERIFAVGDAVQVEDAVLGGPAIVPLAGPANRQARIAVDVMFGRNVRYHGVEGTSIVRLFGKAAALTGASEKSLVARKAAYKKVYVHRPNHVTYYPGAQLLTIKLLFAPDSGKLYGAQVVGGEGVDKRIDVLAAAIRFGATVHDLEDLELAYSPQYGAAKDPVNIAGFVASNYLQGDEDYVFTEDLLSGKLSGWEIIDVREPSEYAVRHIDRSVNIPLGSVRDRLSELDPTKPLAVYCGVGQRAYYATRILRQSGFSPKNLAGGMQTYALYVPAE